jgi:hypothetical protein
MILLSLNLLPWRTYDNGLFLFTFKIKTLQVLGIREDPSGCDRPPRALGAFLFFEIKNPRRVLRPPGASERGMLGKLFKNPTMQN